MKSVFGMNTSIYLLVVISVVLFLGRYASKFFQPKIQKPDAVEAGSTGKFSATTGPVCAAKNGLYGAVRHLLREGTGANGPGIGYASPGWTPLQAVAGGGHLDVVKPLIREGATINVPASLTSSGLTALDMAARGCRIEVVKCLTNEKPNVDTGGYCSDGHTTLDAAVMGGHLQDAELLLSERADINAPGNSSKGQATLEGAATGGHLGIAERLVREKVDVNMPYGQFGQTVLNSVIGGGHPETVEYLVREKAKVNADSSGCGWTALYSATRGGHLETVERPLIPQHTGLRTVRPDSTRLAVTRGHAKAVKLLLQGGADGNAPGTFHEGLCLLPKPVDGNLGRNFDSTASINHGLG